MKKILLTLIVIMQAVCVMAAAPASENRDDKAQTRATEMRKAVRPWVIVAVNGEGLLPQAHFGKPKGKWDAEEETPKYHKVGKPKGQYVAEPETPKFHKDGKPIGKWDAVKETPLEK